MVSLAVMQWDTANLNPLLNGIAIGVLGAGLVMQLVWRFKERGHNG